jgi:hypothetical protein
LLVDNFELGSGAFFVFFDEREPSGRLVLFATEPIEEIQGRNTPSVPPQTLGRNRGGCRLIESLGMRCLIPADGKAKGKSAHNAKSGDGFECSIHWVHRSLFLTKKRGTSIAVQAGSRIAVCNGLQALDGFRRDRLRSRDQGRSTIRIHTMDPA